VKKCMETKRRKNQKIGREVATINTGVLSLEVRTLSPVM